MITTIPITKVRTQLGSIIKRVRVNKEQIVIEKDGYPVAAIMDIDEFEDYLDMHNPKIKKEIAESMAEYKAGKYTNTRELLNELKKEYEK